jgi:hypothetical protein
MIEPSQFASLGPLIRRFTRECDRKRRLREEIRAVVREELAALNSNSKGNLSART